MSCYFRFAQLQHQAPQSTLKQNQIEPGYLHFASKVKNKRGIRVKSSRLTWPCKKHWPRLFPSPLNKVSISRGQFLLLSDTQLSQSPNKCHPLFCLFLPPSLDAETKCLMFSWASYRSLFHHKELLSPVLFPFSYETKSQGWAKFCVCWLVSTPTWKVGCMLPDLWVHWQMRQTELTAS